MSTSQARKFISCYSLPLPPRQWLSCRRCNITLSRSLKTVDNRTATKASNSNEECLNPTPAKEQETRKEAVQDVMGQDARVPDKSDTSTNNSNNSNDSNNSSKEPSAPDNKDAAVTTVPAMSIPASSVVVVVVAGAVAGMEKKEDKTVVPSESAVVKNNPKKRKLREFLADNVNHPPTNNSNNNNNNNNNNENNTSKKEVENEIKIMEISAGPEIKVRGEEEEEETGIEAETNIGIRIGTGTGTGTRTEQRTGPEQDIVSEKKLEETIDVGNKSKGEKTNNEDKAMAVEAPSRTETLAPQLSSHPRKKRKIQRQSLKKSAMEQLKMKTNAKMEIDKPSENVASNSGSGGVSMTISNSNSNSNSNSSNNMIGNGHLNGSAETQHNGQIRPPQSQGTAEAILIDEKDTIPNGHIETYCQPTIHNLPDPANTCA
ncbi:RmlC-like cupin family protein, partial [Reticulomyxa filosa]